MKGVVVALAGLGILAWWGHRKLNHLENLIFSMDGAIQATSIGTSYGKPLLKR